MFLINLVGFSLYYVSVVAGQLLASVLMDTLGLQGYAKRKASLLRLVSVFGTLAGCVLVQNFNVSSCHCALWWPSVVPSASFVGCRTRNRSATSCSTAFAAFSAAPRSPCKLPLTSSWYV